MRSQRVARAKPDPLCARCQIAGRRGVAEALEGVQGWRNERVDAWDRAAHPSFRQGFGWTFHGVDFTEIGRPAEGYEGEGHESERLLIAS